MIKRCRKINPWFFLSVILATSLSLLSTAYFYQKNLIVAYGDAESHLNIAKRVIHGLTPGLAQLGGVWLPIPHLMLIPGVFFDYLWQTGLAGSLVSGVAFLISVLALYQLVYLLTRQDFSAFFATLIFMINPNVLYLQSTPMTELILVCFFLLNNLFFFKFIHSQQTYFLSLAAFFGLAATLSRYDGWLLVLLEAGAVIFFLNQRKKTFSEIEGKLVLFSSMAFFGIVLWLVWNTLIFGHPFYFNVSQFSAKSQQMAWLARNELPAYHNLVLSFSYYLITVLNNTGIPVFLAALVGLGYHVLEDDKGKNLIIALILTVPFFFYVSSLYLGQSVIFTPELTPKTFQWQLFNVRYGLMMVPSVAVFSGYFVSRFFYVSKIWAVFLAGALLLIQATLYYQNGFESIVLQDGVEGLSAAKKVDAQSWLAVNYDGGLVLLDDYARAMSLIRTSIPMNNLIYVGTKPYWEESFSEPEKYARWIVIQRNDEVWRNIYEKPEIQARLYKFFNKVYTSEEILVFKKIPK